MWFSRQSIFIIVLIGLIVFIAAIEVCQRRYSTRDEIANNETTKVHPLYKKWAMCMKKEIESFNGKESSFHERRQFTLNHCTRIVSKKLKMKSFQHLDEVKYHIFPIVPDNSTIVTVGVGRDTHVEKMLWKALANSKAVFFGTDPFAAVNENIYSSIGNFFPFAIGVDSGFSKTRVFVGIDYQEKLIIHMDFIYFIKNFVRNQLIDALWLQDESPENGLLELFHRNGEFDKNGIVFCQINMEIDILNKEQRNRTIEFLLRTFNEGRYAMFHLRKTNHINIFLVNFEDFNCRKKYVPRIDE